MPVKQFTSTKVARLQSATLSRILPNEFSRILATIAEHSVLKKSSQWLLPNWKTGEQCFRGVNKCWMGKNN